MTPLAAVPIDRDAYALAMLRHADRIADGMRTEDPATIHALIQAALASPAPTGEDPTTALVCALAVQVDTDVPWRQRFAWTHDVDAVAEPIVEPGPSTASYLSASPCLDGATWGVAPSSSTARTHRSTA